MSNELKEFYRAIIRVKPENRDLAVRMLRIFANGSEEAIEILSEITNHPHTPIEIREIVRMAEAKAG